jgi:Tfp pilus assembly protein PilN
VVILLVVIGMVYGYMFYRQSQIQGKIEDVLDEISVVEREITGFQDIRAQAQALREKVDSVNQLLDNHVYWSQFLSYLEKYTIEDVYYSNLSGNTNGKITLTATARDLTALANQYTIFQNATDFVEEVEIETAVTEAVEEESESTKIGFSIALEINQDIFYKDNASE